MGRAQEQRLARGIILAARIAGAKRRLKRARNFIRSTDGQRILQDAAQGPGLDCQPETPPGTQAISVHTAEAA
ncbi:hypothetical protein ATY30_03100 [Sinorhizobium americanum]|nr:hypothetical protein CO664_27985 [Sinorhizobium sp. NG07B]POH33278.1 hypothetical protein ATY30_03100 [Sinorhizobium americanum]